MIRWMKLTAPAACGLLALTLASPALADGSCPTLDPACLVEGAVSDAGDTVGEIVDPVDEATRPVVERVLEEIDQILGGGGSVDPPGGGGGNDDGPGVRGDTGGTTGGGRERDGLLAPGSSRITSQQVFDGTASGQDVFIRPRADLPGSGPGGGLGGVLAGAARSTLVVLVLLGVALAFVVIQNRLDRNDPKLALAQVRPDALRFE
jgi:hypothetical protein